MRTRYPAGPVRPAGVTEGSRPDAGPPPRTAPQAATRPPGCRVPLRGGPGPERAARPGRPNPTRECALAPVLTGAVAVPSARRVTGAPSPAVRTRPIPLSRTGTAPKPLGT